MKIFAFHLMPYAALDPAYGERHNSAWVTLPNTYFDPAIGHVLYNRYLDELELADESGFDGVCVNEHHQNAYGIMPIPSVIAGALSRRIKGKIAVLGRALPLLNNPLTVAEEFAMLDVITGGRLIGGFVRGIGAEYFSWGANPAESHERFQEAHDLIVEAWTRPGPFHYEGQYYDFQYVNVWPRPMQQPHPPIWIPSQGSSETIRWAAASERRYTYLQTYSPISAVKRALDMYRSEAQKAGYESSPDKIGWMVPIYVAETDERAKNEAKPHIEAFTNRFMRKPREMQFPPGYLSLRSMKAVMEAKAGRFRVQTIDEMIDQGTLICGSADTVRRRLLELHYELGFGNLLALLQFGTLPAELSRKNIELFASDVMPFLRDNVDSASPIAVPA